MIPLASEVSQTSRHFWVLYLKATGFCPLARTPPLPPQLLLTLRLPISSHKMAPLQAISTSVLWQVVCGFEQWRRAWGTSDKASLPWVVCLNPSLCGCTALSLFAIQYWTPVDDWQGQTWNNIISGGQWPAIINSFPNSLLPVVDYWQWLCFIAWRKMSLLLPVSKTALRVFSTPEKRAFHETGS